VVLSLDWNDLGGTLKQVWGDQPVAARVIQVSADQHNHRGWSADHQGLPAVDLYMLCDPDAATPLLLSAVPARAAIAGLTPAAVPEPRGDALSIHAVAHAFEKLTAGTDVCVTRVPLGWNGAYRHFRHPLDYLGTDGGGGIGSGPGMAVGAALALKDSGRLTAAVLGDGDTLMGITAFWTAAHYKIPLLAIVCNNRSFFNDELHQERVAVARSRPVENKWIGQRISDPDIDLAAMARAQGCEGIGPVTTVAELTPALERAISIVRAGGTCLVDVRVLPGYDTNMSGQPSAAHKR
jgi:thiamine pyrophosphate-dependent acetolactate synthase large subunit-like protein